MPYGRKFMRDHNRMMKDLGKPVNWGAEAEKLRRPGGRRHKLPPGECRFCDEERGHGNEFHPSHDASETCQSGKRPHCTCDSCF